MSRRRGLVGLHAIRGRSGRWTIVEYLVYRRLIVPGAGSGITSECSNSTTAVLHDDDRPDDRKNTGHFTLAPGLSLTSWPAKNADPQKSRTIRTGLSWQ
jgi:hypothetical protein